MVHFTLRSMLAVIALVAAAMAVQVAPPNRLTSAILVLAVLGLPALLTIGVVYGTSAMRSLCIAALFPAGMMFLISIPICWQLIERSRFSGGDIERLAVALKTGCAASWAMAVLTGVACLLASQFLHKASQRAKDV